MGKKKPETDKEILPPEAEDPQGVLRQAGAFASEPRREAFMRTLRSLAPAPPSCLLVEGGSFLERRLAALYWAALINCARTGREYGSPCLNCSSCVRFLCLMHRDLLFLDGGSGNIAIDEVRALRALIWEKPHDAVWRVNVLYEAQAMLAPAANALLKALEEPGPGNIFVLTAPQRERLLPTLVSRSWTITLPWPREGAPEDPQILEWCAVLGNFIQSGRGWMERSGKKGALTEDLASAVLLLLQRSLISALREAPAERRPAENALIGSLARLSCKNLRLLYEALAEAQDSLRYKANAALVMDWLATRIFLMFAQDRPRVPR
ncbi:MAG: DNA polymerase III subunit delta' [Desulfovibrionaceae bacterium]|nr:DNA polymerase III subunit delta' [Desulfovibrionaceae bacterium]